MADSSVAIANSAGFKVGAEPILSFNDNTKLADYCKTNYESARRTVLRALMPHFARKRVVLSPDTTAPAFSFTHKFPLPSDYIKLVPNDGSLKYTDVYEIEDRHILFNDDTLKIVYIYDMKDPTKMDSLFSEALAAYMAWDMCYWVTKSRTLKQDLWNDYSILQSRAATGNAQERPQQVIEANDWLDSRHMGTTEIPNRDYD